MPHNTTKPNPEILGAIIADFNADKDKSIYIGDKLDRDVYMAQIAVITAIYTNYGHIVDGECHILHLQKRAFSIIPKALFCKQCLSITVLPELYIKCGKQ